MVREAASHSGHGAFWAVIPAGGSGTRLWPLSRAARPKFLLPLVGELSLLQETVNRLEPLAPAERTMIVCGPNHAAAVARQVPDVPETNIVVEPAPKGSGSAIGLAAAFRNAIATAIDAAQPGWLVTVGLTPSRPETGYGYIERSDEVVASSELGTAYRGLRFHEKPSLERATMYVDSGRFCWNASMFVWRVATILDEMARQMPVLHAAVTRIAAVWDSPERERVTAEIWAELDEVTIDHGIMEHAERVAVVPAEMGWSDVGDWHGLGDLIEQDSLGNSVRGDFIQVETSNSVVWSESNRLVALVGLDNIVVVDTPDALLVIDRSRAQDVRKVVDQLKLQQRSET